MRRHGVLLPFIPFAESGIMKSKRLILYMATVATIAVSFWFIIQPLRQLINGPLHSVMEAMESLSALLIALSLLSTEEKENKLVPPALGFLAMGIIDIFHAISSPGEQFVSLRIMASFAGGLGFSLAWLPASLAAVLRKKPVSYAVAAGSLALGVCVFLFPGAFPAMLQRGAFTGTAVSVNILGGVFFIIGTCRFALDLRRSDKTEDLLFSLAGVFFGIAGLTFKYSMLWSESWWFWHALRLLASVLVLVLLSHRYLHSVAMLKTSLLEREKAEQSLHESETRLSRSYELTKTIIDSMSEVVSLIDVRDFRIIGLNKAFLKEYGYSDESEIIGKHCYEITHHRSDVCTPPDNVCPIAETVVTGEHFSVEHVHSGKTGEKIYVEVSTSPIKDDNGKVVQVVHVERNITDRKQAENRIRTALLEKETLLKELYHRTKNNMQVISSMITLQAARAGESDVQDLVRETRSRIRAMALVHEKLYKSSDLSNINMKDYVRELAGSIFDSYKNILGRVSLDLRIDALQFPIDYAIPCGLILNELISNSVKHAFPGDRTGEIRIALYSDRGRFRLEYADNGVGFGGYYENLKKKSLGLQIIQTLINQVGGEMEVTNRNGAGYIIKFGEEK